MRSYSDLWDVLAGEDLAHVRDQGLEERVRVVEATQQFDHVSAEVVELLAAKRSQEHR
jgi:hypothetical protein